MPVVPGASRRKGARAEPQLEEERPGVASVRYPVAVYPELHVVAVGEVERGDRALRAMTVDRRLGTDGERRPPEPLDHAGLDDERIGGAAVRRSRLPGGRISQIIDDGVTQGLSRRKTAIRANRDQPPSTQRVLTRHELGAPRAARPGPIGQASVLGVDREGVVKRR